MKTGEFLSILDNFNAKNRDTWQDKNKEYANGEDIFRNFNSAASMTLTGGRNYIAAWNFAVKHLISISDIIKNQEKFTDEQLNEKFGDFMVYLHMIRAMIIEERRMLSK